VRARRVPRCASAGGRSRLDRDEVERAGSREAEVRRDDGRGRVSLLAAHLRVCCTHRARQLRGVVVEHAARRDALAARAGRRADDGDRDDRRERAPRDAARPSTARDPRRRARVRPMPRRRERREAAEGDAHREHMEHTRPRREPGEDERSERDVPDEGEAREDGDAESKGRGVHRRAKSGIAFLASKIWLR
jgi:hypothetical protein